MNVYHPVHFPSKKCKFRDFTRKIISIFRKKSTFWILFICRLKMLPINIIDNQTLVKDTAKS
jgi:hypothetical protein